MEKAKTIVYKAGDLVARLITVRNLKRGAILALILTLLYIMFGPINPASFNKLEVVNANNARPGDTLTYEAEVCRYVGRSVRTDIIRSLISTDDSTITPIVLSQDTLSNDQGCHDVRRTVLIPSTTPPGCYKLRVTASYDVIPIRQPIDRGRDSQRFCLQPPDINQRIKNLQDQLDALEAQQEAEQAIDSQSTTNGSVSAPETPVAQPQQQNTTPAPAQGGGNSDSNGGGNSGGNSGGNGGDNGQPDPDTGQNQPNNIVDSTRDLTCNLAGLLCRQ